MIEDALTEESALIHSFIKSKLKSQPCSYFTQPLVGELTAFLKDRSAQLKKDYDRYADMSQDEAPAFYHTTWYSILGDANYIVVLCNLHVIGRRIAFSPDGWASVQSRETHVESFFDVMEEIRSEPRTNSCPTAE